MRNGQDGDGAILLINAGINNALTSRLNHPQLNLILGDLKRLGELRKGVGRSLGPEVAEGKEAHFGCEVVLAQSDRGKD